MKQTQDARVALVRDALRHLDDGYSVRALESTIAGGYARRIEFRIVQGNRSVYLRLWKDGTLEYGVGRKGRGRFPHLLTGDVPLNTAHIELLAAHLLELRGDPLFSP